MAEEKLTETGALLQAHWLLEPASVPASNLVGVYVSASLPCCSPPAVDLSSPVSLRGNEHLVSAPTFELGASWPRRLHRGISAEEKLCIR